MILKTQDELRDEIKNAAIDLDHESDPAGVQALIKKLNDLNAQLSKAKARDDRLLQIARHRSWAVDDRGDLEDRGNDDDDFVEVSVWSLKMMLQDAYEAGARFEL